MNLRRRSEVSSEFEKNAQSFGKYCLDFGDTFLFCWYYNNNFIHSVKEKQYDVPVKLFKGEFSILVSECTRLQKSTIMKFWESKGKFPAMEIRCFITERN